MPEHYLHTPVYATDPKLNYPLDDRHLLTHLIQRTYSFVIFVDSAMPRLTIQWLRMAYRPSLWFRVQTQAHIKMLKHVMKL